MTKLTAPNGAIIIGTLESVPGVAYLLSDSLTRNAAGGVEYDYSGNTVLDWDDQVTITRDHGQVVFVDEDGDEWLEDELIEEVSDDCDD